MSGRDSVGWQVSPGDLNAKHLPSFPAERLFSQQDALGGTFGPCLKVRFLGWTELN